MREIIIECKHCKGDVQIRNPTGNCDHLYYPENCQICREMNYHQRKPGRRKEDKNAEILLKACELAIRLPEIDRIKEVLRWAIEATEDKSNA